MFLKLVLGNMFCLGGPFDTQNEKVPMYYVEKSYPAIIDKEMWEAVQLEMQRRVWQCNKKYEKKGEVNCKNKLIDEEVLYKAFVSSKSRLYKFVDEFRRKS